MALDSNRRLTNKLSGTRAPTKQLLSPTKTAHHQSRGQWNHPTLTYRSWDYADMYIQNEEATRTWFGPCSEDVARGLAWFGSRFPPLLPSYSHLMENDDSEPERSDVVTTATNTHSTRKNWRWDHDCAANCHSLLLSNNCKTYNVVSDFQCYNFIRRITRLMTGISCTPYGTNWNTLFCAQQSCIQCFFEKSTGR